MTKPSNFFFTFAVEAARSLFDNTWTSNILQPVILETVIDFTSKNNAQKIQEGNQEKTEHIV